MRGYVAFLKKEWMESVRSYRLLILGIAFLFFGITSSLMAKLLPEIIGSMDMQGMELIIPDPTAMDAYTQFYKNTTQMGSIVMLLVFSGVLSAELSKGTLINVLTKGLSRTSVVLAKYTMMAMLWTIVYSGAASINYGYTKFLFPEDTLPHIFYAYVTFWVFGLFLLALLLLGSALFSGSYSGLIFTVAVVIVLMLIGMVPKLSDYNPLTLASVNTSLLDGSVKIGDTRSTMAITIGGTVAAVLGTVIRFRKRAV